MSKTFKSSVSDLELCVIRSNEGNMRVLVDSCARNHAAIDLAPSDAPALCLAILEAAGHVDASKGGHITRVSNAMYLLQEHIELEAVNAAAEADRVKLEAEAVKLYKAFTGYAHTKELSDTAAPEKWLAVARRARELNKEAG